MSAHTAYSESLKQPLGAVIDTLKLDDLQARFLRSRWLDQILWMENRATHARRWYYVLRLVAIIGGVIVPVLVGFSVPGWIIASLSTLVAISAAVEEFFRYGERWRHYRRR